jgi:hypothetical protein
VRPTAIVLATSTELDVDAARALNEYGDLDDQGVARGLEQVHMQRWGRADCPAHLIRLSRVAALVEQGTELRLRHWDLAGCGDEASLLQALFDAWPTQDGAVVDWHGDIVGLLMARACRHGLVIPAMLQQRQTHVGLGGCLAPAALDHPADPDEVESEYYRLSGHESAPRLLTERAVARYRLWLAWQASQGSLSAAEIDARQDALARELQAVEA